LPVSLGVCVFITALINWRQAMKSNGPRRTQRSILMASVALLLLLPNAASIAFGNGKLRVIVVAETLDARIGTSVQVDLDNISNTFRPLVAGDVLEITTIEGNQVTRAAIFQKIAAVQVDPTDALLIYYSGHGGFDQNQNDHVCALPNELVYRTELREALTGRGARLSVLITDACSNMMVPREILQAAPAPRLPQLSILFRTLFFDCAGLVDISATRPGEIANGYSTTGGCFTSAFMSVLQANRDQALTWDAVLQQARDQANQASPHQNAYALSTLPVPNPGANNDGRARFGVVADSTPTSAPFHGVEVEQILPGSPATRIRDVDGQISTLAPGRQVITHVNGAPVPTKVDLLKQERSAGDIMTIRVHALDTGRTGEYTVDLNRRGGQRLRLGVAADATPTGTKFGGLQVLEVMAGYPATRMTDANGQRYTLEPYRDIILKVNGIRTTSVAEFLDAIRKSPRNVMITVYDVLTKKTDTYSGELQD
jgi:hypothetical protein